jgi:hypothetical protein
VTCGAQFGASDEEPAGCPISLDARQYVGPAGRQWTTLDGYRKSHENVFSEEERDMYSIHPRKAEIGQRAFLVRA